MFSGRVRDNRQDRRGSLGEGEHRQIEKRKKHIQAQRNYLAFQLFTIYPFSVFLDHSRWA